MGLVASVLVVCVGNVCRSPVGEALLKAACPHLVVSSAGLGALVGASADPVMAEAAGEIGLDLSDHVAKQLNRRLASAYDLVLVMEQSHREEIRKLYPEAAGRTMFFDQWVGRRGISDPYRKPLVVHRQIRDELLTAANAWVVRLRG